MIGKRRKENKEKEFKGIDYVSCNEEQLAKIKSTLIELNILKPNRVKPNKVRLNRSKPNRIIF